ncbi:hypothetical protein Aduo_003313 [Ancylostoma duodenale]
MFALLLVILCIHEAFTIRPRTVCSDDPAAADLVRRKLLETHNAERKNIINGVEQEDGTTLPGSKNLFKVTYDCDLEGVAMTVVRDCPSDPDLSHVPVGKAVNYAIRRHVENALGSDQAYADEMEVVVGEWANYRFDANLDTSTVIYDDEIMEPYANIIYNKTLAIGCTIMWCSSKRLAAACVYSDKPKLGEPLYDPGKEGTKCGGKSCEKVIKGADCITAAEDPALEGLCKTDMKELPTKSTTSSTTSSTTTTTTTSSTTKTTSRTRPKRTKSTTATTTSSTTKRTKPTKTTTTNTKSTKTTRTNTKPTKTTTTNTKPTKTTTTSTTKTTTKKPEVMTQAVRDEIISKHNYYRSTLARGLVRNGKEGNPNCPTAMNMYRMRYDMTLESEAQTYADSCPTDASLLTTRPYSGENFEIIPGTTTPYLDAIEKALDEWWTQILKNGVNNKMQYTEYLANKQNAPTKFTQMAWAETYTVGCGLKRCSHGTVVVCRYKPRGNIYTRYIYRPGKMCGSCSGPCSEGLCPTPAN